MAKPSSLPRWATGGAALVVEPTEGQKDTGWVAGQKPPAQYFNFWWNLVYRWCAYLDGLTNEALTWAAKHAFSAGLSSGVAPTGATDVVRKTELDAEAADRAAGDAAALASANAYTDGKFPAPSWTPITLDAGWSPGSGAQAPAYWKDSAGVVHLRGYATSTSGSANLFTSSPLPSGVRPAVSRVLPVWNSTDSIAAGLNVTSGGTANLWAAVPSGKAIFLDGASFVAEL